MWISRQVYWPFDSKASNLSAPFHFESESGTATFDNFYLPEVETSLFVGFATFGEWCFEQGKDPN